MQFNAAILWKIKRNFVFIPSPSQITEKWSQSNNFKIFTLFAWTTIIKMFYNHGGKRNDWLLYDQRNHIFFSKFEGVSLYEHFFSLHFVQNCCIKQHIFEKSKLLEYILSHWFSTLKVKNCVFCGKLEFEKMATLISKLFLKSASTVP